MSTERIHNFSAGPAVLPLSVVEELQQALPNLAGTGIGLMEISHRSQTFGDIVDSAMARLRRVLALPEDYEVLLLQGGASMQFCMVAMNLLRGGTADYLDTGAWSKKAAVEANRFGTARVVWNGQDVGYSRVPRDEDWSASEGAVYTHYTSNNTIYGTQYHHIPNAAHLVCDMSSDIASRRIDGSKFDVIYAGAQKNLGPSGVTVVALFRGRWSDQTPICRACCATACMWKKARCSTRRTPWESSSSTESLPGSRSRGSEAGGQEPAKSGSALWAARRLRVLAAAGGALQSQPDERQLAAKEHGFRACLGFRGPGCGLLGNQGASVCGRYPSEYLQRLSRGQRAGLCGVPQRV